MSRRESFVFAIAVTLAAFALSWLWEFVLKGVLTPGVGGNWLTPAVTMVITGLALAAMRATKLFKTARNIEIPALNEHHY
jgi:hypothetical protein